MDRLDRIVACPRPLLPPPLRPSPWSCSRSARLRWRAGWPPGETPTDNQVEGFRLLALHRQGARGDPSSTPAARLAANSPITTTACVRRPTRAKPPAAFASEPWSHAIWFSSSTASSKSPASVNSAARRVRCAPTMRSRRRRKLNSGNPSHASCPRLQPPRRSPLRRRQQHLVPREYRRHRHPRHDDGRCRDGRPAGRLHAEEGRSFGR